MWRWLLPLLLVGAAIAAAFLLRPAGTVDGVPGPADEALGQSGIPETDDSPFVVTEDEGAGTVTRNRSE
ncbi:hypothetical protein [Thermaurantiacus sp.]